MEERTKDQNVPKEREDNQPSGGDLVDSQPHSELQTIEERFEDVVVEVIRHFTYIPDYKEPTDLKHPSW
jgi:hypothetical protein